MTPLCLPGIPAPSRRSTYAETVRHCADILAMLDRQREERARRGLKW